MGQVYNIGGRCEKTNLEIVKTICDLLDKICLQSPFTPHASLITYVKDRPGHDRRYAIDCSKIEKELGWRPRETFETGWNWVSGLRAALKAVYLAGESPAPGLAYLPG